MSNFFQACVDQLLIMLVLEGLIQVTLSYICTICVYVRFSYLSVTVADYSDYTRMSNESFFH